MLKLDGLFSILEKGYPYLLSLFLILSSILLCGICIYKWRNLREWFVHCFLGRPRFDYHDILKSFTEKTARKRGVGLYESIVELFVTTVGAAEGSFLVKGSDCKFRVKATFKGRLTSFLVEEGDIFFDYITDYKNIVLRDVISKSSAPSRIKNEALRYMVHFNAFAVVPVFIAGKLHGLINLGNVDNYDCETLELLNYLSIQSAMVIHNANMYSLLLSQNKRLQESKRFRDQLLRNLSHELRTPLNGIIGLTELIANGTYGELNSEQVNYLKMVRQSGTGLMKTVETMLDISKLENNQLHLDVRRVNIDRLLRAVAQGEVFKRNMEFSIEIDPKIAGIYGDEDRLSQVFTTILHAMGGGKRKNKISFTTFKKGDMLMVSVKDIYPNTTPYVANKDKMALNEDTDLDFTLSKKIVEMHGGRVWRGSGKDKKSEYCVALPMRPAAVKSFAYSHC
ncbi:MAG: GAF domain-containing sensor histidine kinase [Pseudomonadota bacterium]